MCVPAAIVLLASATLASVQTTCHVPVTSPNGMAFDGANVWVASGSGSVVAINATTAGPYGIVYESHTKTIQNHLDSDLAGESWRNSGHESGRY